jgi:hypothetical protein
VAAASNGHTRSARPPRLNDEARFAVGGDHRCRAFVDGGDDLGVVDPAQIPGRDRQVGMPELSLDHEQRDRFTRHLDSVSMPQLVGREPAPDTGNRSALVKLGADPG